MKGLSFSDHNPSDIGTPKGSFWQAGISKLVGQDSCRLCGHRPDRLLFLLRPSSIEVCQSHWPFFFFAATHRAGRVSFAGSFVWSSTQAVSSWVCVKPETEERLAP